VGVAVVVAAIAIFSLSAIPGTGISPRSQQTPPRSATGLLLGECEGVQLTPSDDIQRKLQSRPEGKTFCLAPGTYRISGTLVPKAGQKLIGTGKRAAVISGARIVEASPEGDYWVITGQRSLGRSEFDWPGQCRPVNGVDPKGMCVFKDQVFLDDVSLWQVGSLAELSTGEFYWDYGANKIYLADDPEGRGLEVSVFGDHAIQGESPRVVIRNLVVEKFANSVQGGAIQAGPRWRITDSEIRLNHGGGVHMDPGTVLRRNYIHHNGQIGIHGGQVSCSATEGLIVEDNEIAFNNAAGYNWGFEAGAAKWTNTKGLIVRNNDVHDNYGMGLWTDGLNTDPLYEGNLVEDNHGAGINVELNLGVVIRDNVVRRNGLHYGSVQSANPWLGAGIYVDQSRDVEIYDNVVEDNAAGITALQEPAGARCGSGIESEVANLHVHNNTVRQTEGLAAGLKLFREDDDSYYHSKNNHWEENIYLLGDPEGGLHFFWLDRLMTAEEWRAQGHDDGS